MAGRTDTAQARACRTMRARSVLPQRTCPIRTTTRRGRTLAGRFRRARRRNPPGAPTTPPAPSCETQLGTLRDRTVDGSLAVGCTSQRPPGSTSSVHWRRYTFSLGSPTWVSVDPTGSGASRVASLQLISGRSGDGEVLAEAKTGSGGSSSSRLSDVFLPAGDYSIEATGPATGSFKLAIDVKTEAEGSGPVVVAGLPQAIWAVAGQEQRLVFSFYFIEPGDALTRSVRLTPSAELAGPVKAQAPGVQVVSNEGSGTVTLSPGELSAGVYRVVLEFRRTGSTAVLGRVGFQVKVCSAGQAVGVGGSMACSGDPVVGLRVSRLSHGSVPSACIERLPTRRWHMVVRRWPAADSSCAVLDGVGNRPARYFVLEVPFGSAEVTLRLTSAQDTYLMLSRRVASRVRCRRPGHSQERGRQRLPQPRQRDKHRLVDRNDAATGLLRRGGHSACSRRGDCPARGVGRVHPQYQGPISRWLVSTPDRHHHRRGACRLGDRRDLRPPALVGGEEAPMATSTHRSERSVSRRAFLAVVGAVSGVALAPSLARAQQPSEGEDGAGDSPPVVDGFQVVEVEPGFVDATNWNGRLLTLRPDTAGMVVRSELEKLDHKVDGVDGFAGRCLSAHGDMLVIGGHRVVQTGTMNFEAGISYDTLLAQSGAQAELLAAQPRRPAIRPYRHVFIDRFPSLLLTRDLIKWDHLDVPLAPGTGGSFGAAIERGGILAADHYLFAEVPDSVVEASLISLPQAILGQVSAARAAIPLDHGAVWGTSDTGVSGLLIIGDRRGTYGYDDKDRPLIKITDGSSLLGVNPVGPTLEVAVKAPDGSRHIKRFTDGTEQDPKALALDEPIKHRISPEVAILALDGKHNLINNTNVAKRHEPNQKLED